mmetsp:Transcript_19285/g.21273  ORF Transcript_19285/g.21273 Transcript_19285/m.21273 type:complete len:559 (+) Transcript_19285:106-1782(+)
MMYGDRPSSASASTSGSVWKSSNDDDEEIFTDDLQQLSQQDETERNKSQKGWDRRLFFALYVLLLLALSGLAFSITRYVQAKMRNVGPGSSTTDPDGITSSSSSSSSSSSNTLEESDPNRDPIKYRSDIESILSTVVEEFTFLEGAQKKALDWLVFEDLVLTSADVKAMMGSTKNDDNDNGSGSDDDGVGVPIFPLVQRYALMVLFFETNGELWSDTSWSDLIHVHECNFMGIDCDGNKGQAVNLDLQYRKLRGRLPDETGLLTQLTAVNLMANNLEGSIPSFMYNELTNLEFLDLSRNDFTSTISSDISNLTSLKSLVLNDLSLTGSVPESLKSVSTLEDFSIWHGGKMSGPILDFMSYWPNLVTMDIYQSSFTGTIPTSIGINSNLKLFWIEDTPTDITDIPTELGLLTDLEEFAIGSRIGLDGGTLPTELGSCTSLRNFQIDGNNYTGTIPTEIGLLTNLASLVLSGGRLTGTLPSEVGNLTNLVFLLLHENELKGILPSEMGSLTALDTLDISDNDMTGTGIPESICSSHPDVWIDCKVEKCSCCYRPCFSGSG